MNESAITGPLGAQFSAAASIAAAAATRASLEAEVGGYNVDAVVSRASANALALVGASLPGVLNAMVAALDTRFAVVAPAKVVTKVDSATYDVAEADGFLAVTRTTAGTCAISIPAAVRDLLRPITVWDAGANAGTNNIQISVEGRTVNGDSAIGISANHGKLTLCPAPGVFDTTGWMAF